MIQQPSIQQLCIHHVHMGPRASQPDTALTQHWSDTDDTPYQHAGGMGMRSTFLPFLSTSLSLHFLEDPRHPLCWDPDVVYINRAVVTRTQQGLAPLLNILHLEAIRGVCTDQVYGSPQKRLREKGSSKASKHRCQPTAMEPLCLITRYCQDKGYSVSNKRAVTLGSVSRKLARVPPERLSLQKWAFLNWFKTNTSPPHTKSQIPAFKYRSPPSYKRNSGIAQSHNKETQNKHDKRCKNEASRWTELTP